MPGAVWMPSSTGTQCQLKRNVNTNVNRRGEWANRVSVAVWVKETSYKGTGDLLLRPRDVVKRTVKRRRDPANRRRGDVARVSVAVWAKETSYKDTCKGTGDLLLRPRHVVARVSVAVWLSFAISVLSGIPAASSSLPHTSRLQQDTLAPRTAFCTLVSPGGNAGTQGVMQSRPALRMSLRGGMQAEDTASDMWEGLFKAKAVGEVGEETGSDTEEGKEAKLGLFPGSWDAWAREQGEPDCDFNVTSDIVNKGSKDEEMAFRRECDEELERHWARVKRIREEDIANGRPGCRHVAENEWCIRKSDGRIWKYRYEPDLYSGCGSSRDENWTLPEPVDYVDPDWLRDIAADLERRDRERAQAQADLLEAYERQQALDEALAWYNGSRRFEYEAGEPVWWRLLNVSKLPNTSHHHAPVLNLHSSPDLPQEEGPETPSAHALEPSEEAQADAEEGEGTTRDRNVRGEKGWRQPGVFPGGTADFSSYGMLPPGYSFRDESAPALTAEQQNLLRCLQREDALLAGREEASGVGCENESVGGGGVGGGVGQGGVGVRGGERAAAGGGRTGANGGVPWDDGEEGEEPWAKEQQTGRQTETERERERETAAILGAQAVAAFNSSTNSSAAGVRDGGVGFEKTAGYVWNELGETLRSTVWRGRNAYVKELLELGADPNYRTVYCGWRPIHYAAWNDYPKIVTLLLQAGADMNARTDYGETPLHLAAIKASNLVIPVLVSAGADTSARHVQGRLALESAHMRMISCEYPLSKRIAETVRLV